MKTFSIGPERLGDFVELSWALHRSDPLWVPPLRAVLERELSGRDAFGRYARMRLFLCESEGATAGRIAAIVNPRLVDASGAPIGQVGYFECVDDARVCGSLLDAAFGWLREQGAREAWGPMNGGAHRSHRFLTEGFERTPFLFEPRNPPHYPRLFEAHGFRALHRWTSYDIAPARLRDAFAGERGYARAAKRIARRYDLDHPWKGDLARTTARLHALLDGFWVGHVGYASMGLDEFVDVFAGVLSVMDPWCLAMAVERDGGRDVASAYAYPDWVQEVRGLQGDAAGWGKWMQGPRPKRCVFHTFAALPKARRAGAALLFLARVPADAAREGYEEGVVALVTEDLHVFDAVAAPTRSYAIYARAL